MIESLESETSLQYMVKEILQMKLRFYSLRYKSAEELMLWNCGVEKPSRPRRGIVSPVALRRGEGAQMKRCRDPRCSPRGNQACRGTFGVT